MSKLNSALIYSWGGVALNFGGFIIIVPLAQLYLGLEEFNFWLFSSTILAFGMILESSLTAPLTRVLTFSAQNKKISSKGNEFALGQKVDTLFTILLILIPLSLVAFIIVFCLGYLSTKGVYEFSTQNFLVIIALTCSFRIYLTLAIANLHSEDKVATQAKIVFIISFVKTLLTVILLPIFEDLSIILFLNLVAVIFELATYVAVSKVTFLKCMTTRRWSKNVVHACYSPVVNTIIIRIGGYFIAQTLPILALRLPLEQSTALLLSVKCVGLAYRIALIPAQVTLPKIIKLRAQGKINNIKTEVTGFVRMSCTVYFSSTFMLIIFAFLNLEIGGVKIDLIEQNLLLFLIFIMFLEMHHVIHAMVYETTNDVPFVKISLISGAMIYIFGTYSVEAAGILGLLITQFSVQLLGNNWYSVMLSLRSLQWPWRIYLSNCVRGSGD